MMGRSGAGAESPGVEDAATAKRSYVFWPPVPNEPHIQYLTSYSASADLLEHPATQATGDTSGITIGKPYGVAMWKDRIYVCDLRAKALLVLDLKGRELRVVANGKGQIQKPVDVAIGADGSKYVADNAQGAIAVIDESDRFVKFIGPEGLMPCSVAVHADELYVAHFKAPPPAPQVGLAEACVQVLDRTTGRTLRTIGKLGSGDGEFMLPVAARSGSDGNIAVVDQVTCRFQTFTSEGTFVRAFGGTGGRPAELVRPKHFALDQRGWMYVADSALDSVQIFDTQGKLVGCFGSRGNHPGAMDLPVGVSLQEGGTDVMAPFIHPAFHAERLIVVTNQFGPRRVSIYAYGGLKPGKTWKDVAGERIEVPATSRNR